jgi:hypothetical protein
MGTVLSVVGSNATPSSICDGRDPADDLGFGAWERAAEDVDVAGHSTCVELGEQ